MPNRTEMQKFTDAAFNKLLNMNPEEFHKAISEHKDGDIANSLSELGYFDNEDEFDEQLSEQD